jgi:hypothetical protein
MRNCVTVVLAARWRLGRGRIILMSWSGAWRSTEWPRVPHFGLKVDNKYIIHYHASDSNLPLHRMLNFYGKVKLKRIKNGPK